MSPTVDQVLKMPPFKALLWVREMLPGAEGRRDEFNWHGLAQCAATLAHLPNAPPPWAHVSVEVYSWLAGHDGKGSGEGFKVSEMYVRCHQIKLHGAAAGDELRDAQVLLDWFHKGNELSVDDVLALIPDWRALPRATISNLRRIKNRLAVLAQIQDQFENDTLLTVRPWLELQPRLP